MVGVWTYLCHSLSNTGQRLYVDKCLFISCLCLVFKAQWGPLFQRGGGGRGRRAGRAIGNPSSFSSSAPQIQDMVHLQTYI